MDVVVVGAGLSGLAAARRIADAGAEVVVLEARERVGGRTERARTGSGAAVDLGGQWVGARHRRIRTIVAELGLRLVPTPTTGDVVWDLGGRRRRRPAGARPPLPGPALVDVGLATRWVERRAREVDTARPWRTPGAADLDARSVGDWVRRRPTATGRALWQIVTRAVLASEPADLSLLHLLFYVRSAGSLDQLLDTDGGAQQDLVDGGVAQVARGLAEQLGDRVRLASPVAELHRLGPDEGVAAVTREGRTVRARRAVVTLPPALAGRVRHWPPLPSRHAMLHQRVPMGSVIKVLAVYDRPFWREEGLSGSVVSDGPVVQVVFDSSPADGSCGVLLTFIEGADAATWSARSPGDRREAVLSRLADLVGPRAAEPVEVLERDWTAEEFTRGCYGGYLPPGVWTTYGSALREPVGGLHWAGSERATTWAGYMEGAVGSGEEVADAVVAALGS